MSTRLHLGCILLSLSLALPACNRSPTDPVVVPTLPPVNPGTVLLHDRFDDENGGAGQNNWTAFQNWDVVDGCVDLHGNGFFDVQAGHGIYVDLDGTCSAGGTIETKQTFDLAAGNYILEFWLAGNHRINTPDTVVVSLGNVFEEQIVMQPGEQFRLFTRVIPVGTATLAKLRFRNLGGDGQGALLDEVRLRRGS